MASKDLFNSIVTTWIIAITAVLGAAFYVWHNIDQLDDDIERLNIDRTLLRIESVEERLKEMANQPGTHIKDVEDRLNEVAKDVEGRLNEVANESGTHIKDVEDRINEVAKDVEGRLNEVANESGTRIKDVENQISDMANKLRQTVSRVPALETGLPQLSEYIASELFDTVYVFKHTFDFPNPSFDIGGDEAKALVCPPIEQSTDDLPEERKLYKDELIAFDDDVELKFYTVGQEDTGSVQAIIRQETACYKHIPTESDAGPAVAQDIRITPAPVRILIQAESVGDDNITFSTPQYLSVDHDDVDSKTFPFRGLPNHAGLQVHSLTAAVSDRNDRTRRFGSRKYCSAYGLKVATRELDRCDFELYVFAHLDSVTKE